MSLSLKSLLSQHNDRVKLLEAHDRDSFRTISHAVAGNGQRFQGIWISGLTQTTCLGVPDTELISPLKRASLLSWLQDCRADDPMSQLCIAFDGDGGGPADEIESVVALLSKRGISTIVIEDKSVEKPGEKVNSLAASSASQAQADMHQFADVIKAYVAAAAQLKDGTDITVTARIESFTTRKTLKDPAEEARSVQAALEDALARAECYRTAGAGAIMIHSKSKQPDEVLTFLRQFRAQEVNRHIPLVVVPTTYSEVVEDTLYRAGANVIIYANHLMRAKIRAIQQMYYDASAVADVDSGSPNVAPRRPSPPPDLFRDDQALSACVTAKNFGCLLRKLRARSAADLAEDEAEFLELANFRAVQAMALAVQDLLTGRSAGAADSHLIPVKDLLEINSQQVSLVETL